MKRAFIIAAVLAIVGFSLYSFHLIYKTSRLSQTEELTVLLVQNPFLTVNSSHVLQAYRSVLDEEGVPYKVVSDNILLNLKFEDAVENIPVIILPDGIAQILPRELTTRITNYLLKGGNVAVIYDAGIKDIKGHFLNEALFSEITGINYITYDRLRADAYTTGYIRMEKKNSEFFQIPYGKTDKNYYILGGYAYGNLKYPISRNELLHNISSYEIYADVITEEGEQFPAVAIRSYGKGTVFFVNLPLGYLKAYSDDFILRTFLRTFLFKVVKIPHLQNTRDGKGGLVINWHIDSSIDWKSIPFMLEKEYLRKGIDYSFHITAGDFRDKPGDSLGFDACGKGRSFTETLLNYGIIGSHGGWAHNWFPGNVQNGNFGKKEIYEYIKKNNECLESITGYKMIEYAAPNGVHPQPVTTEALEELGFLAYYYTGDTGSAPNRTFLDGKMVSEKVFAFPILTFEKFASLLEMKQAGKTEDEVKRWFIETLDYIVKNRTVRLIYSHPYDIPLYPDAFKSFLDYAEQLRATDNIEIKSMSYFAEFLNRFLKTKFTFKREGRKLIAVLKNPEGLDGITVAIPKKNHKKPTSADISIQEDEDYYYISIKGNLNEKNIYVDAL